MVNKQSFLQEINKNTTFNVDFYKKVYGYSVYDNDFLSRVANRLIYLKRPDVIQSYNEWLAGYQAGQNQIMKNVAEWYVKEIDRKYDDKKRQHGKAVRDWTVDKTNSNYLQKMSDKELLNSLKRLRVEKPLQKTE